MSHIGGLAMVNEARTSVSEGMRWHVLSVERTALAQRSLERERIEAWLPLCEVLRTHRPRGARHDVVEPWRGHLFPGYVLARFVSGFWGSVEEIDGVESVLLLDGNPAVLPDLWVRALAAEIELHGGALKITDDGRRRDPNPPRKRGPRYPAHQRLRVVAGDFSGIEGIYICDAKERVALLLDILGRSVRVELPEALVTPA